ncbi:aldo/keto reductase [Chitinophaga sp. 212800010-3]|uniref:aldo/keto reductase n=1 Tax=unclassified Chitinophaga TaxID=2619133 RepID=UPI002DE379D4|nr:Aldo-ket-red domain-containing protein [Chitinophaga sp. 212800010-3]
MIDERLVLGTAALGGVWGKINPDHSVAAILTALESGIPAIDTAPAYGDAELFLGTALRQWKGQRPIISSKTGRLQTFAAHDGKYDFTEKGMLTGVENTLRTLNITALDILFLHDPEVIRKEDAGKIMETLIRCREQGLAKYLGTGGNRPAWMTDYLNAGVFDVMMEFNRLNAANVAAMQDSLPFCRDRHIRYYAASPLNMGLLGKSLDAFRQMKPAWLPAAALGTAGKLEELAASNGMLLRTLAHRFLISLPYQFNIVIGPENKTELEDSLTDFAAGPLPEQVLEEVLLCSQGKL